MRQPALAQQRGGRLRLRPGRRARLPVTAALLAAEAALIRLLLAVLLALLGTAFGYLLLGVVLAVSAGWSREAALDQAFGLAVHAAAVFVRGVLPAVLATGAVCLLWRHSRGADPGAWATLGVSVLLAALVTLLVLTSAIRDWPRLEVRSAVDGVVTVLLLAAAAAGADLLARRWLPRRDSRLR